MSTSTKLILLTLAIMALIDYVPRAFLLIKKSIKPISSSTKIPRYLIMPTVYGDISYLQNTAFLKKYASKVLICTSKYETDEFYSQLRVICRKNGFRYIKVDLPFANGQPIKNAYTIYRGAFNNLKGLKITKETPCLLLDADTYAEKNVNNLIRTFIANDLDIASLRCQVANPKTVIERLQDFEYNLAMDNRRMDPWLTSGACNMAKAAVLKRIFSKHSNFFAGGDIEIGKLAQIIGYKVRYIEFVFYTAAPNTFNAWFKQRIIWFAGGVRHHVTNMAAFGWHHFFMLFYNSLLIYLLFPLRWIELISYPLTLLALICLSWIYTFVIIQRKDWRPILLLLPFYSFIQSMIILPLAFVRYIRYVVIQRSVGLIKNELHKLSFFTKTLYRTLNYGSASLIVYLAITFTSLRIDYWLQNGYVLKLLFR